MRTNRFFCCASCIYYCQSPTKVQSVRQQSLEILGSRYKLHDDATINICHLPNGSIPHCHLSPIESFQHCLLMICVIDTHFLASWLCLIDSIRCMQTFTWAHRIRQLFRCLANKAIDFCGGEVGGGMEATDDDDANEMRFEAKSNRYTI